MYCGGCGKELLQGAKFCRDCGQSAGAVSAPVQQLPLASLDSSVGDMVSSAQHGAVPYACPRCSAGMVVVMRRSRKGLGVIFFGAGGVLGGLFLLIIPLIGWILGPLMMIGGFIMWFIGAFMLIGGKGTVHYQCPSCNYSN